MLKSIPASSEFWIAAHHGLRHLEPYPVDYALRDPYQFGPGVPEGTFAKILDGMVSGALDEVSSVQAISAFSNYCTEEEWTSWYRPVLEKRLRISTTITEFNKVAPKEYRVTDAPTLPVLESVAQAGGLPEASVIEPYSAGERLLVLLQGKTTYVFLEDGTPAHRMLPQVIDRFRSNDTVVLELIDDHDKLYARDILLWDQYTNKSPCPSVDRRLAILQEMLAGQDALEVVEHFYHDGTTNPREDIATALQCGFPGLVFRSTNIGLLKDNRSILVHPKRKSVMTCTRIEEGEGKYTGVVEYLWGTGRMNKQGFESPVFHGLTFQSREQILPMRDEFIGRKFDVVSCGLDPNGKLIFPIFKQWKEQK